LPPPKLKEIVWPVACKDDDFVVSSNGMVALQPEQAVVANQRSEEPVLSTRLKDWDLSTDNTAQKPNE
jgi:hypothetical protein